MELTLIEKLRQMEAMKPGMMMPEWLVGPGSWGIPLSALFREAADEIERLRRTAGETTK